MRCTKAKESLMWESVVPLMGFRILTSSLWVGEPIADTIGRKRIPSLWTFGSP